ncbi:hypothetical protein HYH03_010203 [Edaphochlamys debaryana]|uniref:Dolichol-phosphate mannosyltransferase subunit 1 n=1 Tax=Edaphochlamys debaryana TaxID=47281 RepID=A0A835XX36_9CHLO|nr:hypothetical protein HYH03_010203 [Edaphochlamys debaryana]|eukprot:KAG2491414.1 hypothetical protein HYH03_010203 [Edaphochlamys debaryana]
MSAAAEEQLRQRKGREGGASAATPELSVIVPTYNERENVAVLTWMLHKVLADVVTYEIIFVDDASPDGTATAVKQLQDAFGADCVKLVSRPGKLGLGSAYTAGLAAASGELVVLMDADLSHHPKHLPAMLAALRDSGADIVSGTRYRLGGGVAGWNLRRKLTSRGANLLASFLLGARTSDLTGAYRLYRRQALAALLQRTASVGYAFQMEIIVRAQYMGYRIAEVPIVFVDRLYGTSKLGVGEYVQFVKGLARLLVGL